jgi:hypothetical protein
VSLKGFIRTYGHRVWCTVENDEAARLRKLMKAARQHPEWATETMERGPTPISKGWEKSR